MSTKTVQFRSAKFSEAAIREALIIYEKIVQQNDAEKNSDTNLVNIGDEQWEHDSEEEFFSDYRKSDGLVLLKRRAYKKGVHITLEIIVSSTGSTTVSFQAPTRTEIESLFAIFSKHYEGSLIPKEIDSEPSISPVIFIGHGQSQQWRDLKDHLQDKHGFEIEAYETGTRAGHTIRDILDEMSSKSSLAFLVLTAEDEQKDGSFHARQNVVHETGLFQGKLGFSRAIVLLEEGAEEFSNLQGIQQIRFSKNNIKETFGEVLATIRREFN